MPTMSFSWEQQQIPKICERRIMKVEELGKFSPLQLFLGCKSYKNSKTTDFGGNNNRVPIRI